MIGRRRDFLKRIVAAAGGLAAARAWAAPAARAGETDGARAVLVDTTRCVGCRRCEQACNEANPDLPRKPAGHYADPAVGAQPRRMDAADYTVVNRYAAAAGAGAPVHVKFQCMHCLEPACVSACIVGALVRNESGAVAYDAWKCIGCRYCMVACPFQVPAYEYPNALAPQVRKCTFCEQTRLAKGRRPACVEACPMEVMTFGSRPTLLRMAWERIRARPDRYQSHVYGEHEVGGAAWLYLAAAPFERIGFPRLGNHPVPRFTEPIQHAIFKWFLPPLGLYAALGGVWWYIAARKKGAS
jgi:Fe-S-cluster-containing dehydrogenase component